MSRFYEDIEVGEKLPPSRQRTLTARDIENYCDFSGDWSGHWATMLSDEADLEATRLGADRQTAPAMLVVSQQYGLRPSAEPHTGLLALYQWEEVRYLRPLRVGDIYYFEHEVLSKELRGPDYGVIRTRRVVRNQRGEAVLTMVERTRYRTRAAWEQLQATGAEPLRRDRDAAAPPAGATEPAGRAG